MLNQIIRFSLEQRLLVLVCAVLVVFAGAIAFQQLPIDAFPDTTPVMVQVNTTAPSRAGRHRVANHLPTRASDRRVAGTAGGAVNFQNRFIADRDGVRRRHRHSAAPANWSTSESPAPTCRRSAG